LAWPSDLCRQPHQHGKKPQSDHATSVKRQVPTVAVSAKKANAQAMQLAPEERLALIDGLLDTLEVPYATLDALWAKEAESRLAAYRRGEIQAAPLSDVIAKYQADSRRNFGVRLPFA
jgi:putative addiction module component (TIGR02574 family)